MKVTYIPGDGDPIRTVWNGVVFEANIPVELTDKNTIINDQVHRVDMPDGSYRTVTRQHRLSMIELAKHNPSFQVEGEPIPERKPGRPRIPKSPDEYRSFAQEWIARASDPKQMDARWDKEEELRTTIGVGDEDVSYLRPFFHAKQSALKHEAT